MPRSEKKNNELFDDVAKKSSKDMTLKKKSASEKSFSTSQEKIDVMDQAPTSFGLKLLKVDQ